MLAYYSDLHRGASQHNLAVHRAGVQDGADLHLRQREALPGVQDCDRTEHHGGVQHWADLKLTVQGRTVAEFNILPS